MNRDTIETILMFGAIFAVAAFFGGVNTGARVISGIVGIMVCVILGFVTFEILNRLTDSSGLSGLIAILMTFFVYFTILIKIFEAIFD